ncbi:unnamed protein product [Pleuronectes platessa]|uniref:Uncharacterized protein n=1 Tax=Pleuronectes platessa TaxID=8262 RepID=A0A9N7ZAB7_PLEPL|nr:unnamed protein product [Pleuronectes platessa]
MLRVDQSVAEGAAQCCGGVLQGLGLVVHPPLSHHLHWVRTGLALLIIGSLMDRERGSSVPSGEHNFIKKESQMAAGPVENLTLTISLICSKRLLANRGVDDTSKKNAALKVWPITSEQAFVTWQWLSSSLPNMLLVFFLLFFSSVSTVKSQSTNLPESTTQFISTTAKETSPPPSIIPTQPAETGNLGMPGFVLALLALIVSLSVLCWLGWERLRGTQPPSNTAAKGFPAPVKAQKGGLPPAQGDGDVYMNYTSPNQDYSNLDPVNMTGDNMYSSLS